MQTIQAGRRSRMPGGFIAIAMPPRSGSKNKGEKLLMAIYQCGYTLAGLCQYIWASVKGIGALGQSYSYVRYPYHVGERLQKVSNMMGKILEIQGFH